MKIYCLDGECYDYLDDEFVGYASEYGVSDNFTGETGGGGGTQNTSTATGGTKSGTGWLDVLNTLAGQTGAIFGNTKPNTAYNTGTGVYPYPTTPAKTGISGLAVAGIVLGAVGLVVVIVVVTRKKK